MIEIDPKTLIAQAVNFGILMYLLSRFLFKPIGNFLDNRSQTIKDSLAEIESDREEIVRLREEYQERMTKLDKENYQRMQEAIQKGQEAAAQVVAKSEEKAEQILVETRAIIDREKADALQEVLAEVGNLAVAIASKIVQENYDAKVQKKLISGFISKIQKQDKMT